MLRAEVGPDEAWGGVSERIDGEKFRESRRRGPGGAAAEGTEALALAELTGSDLAGLPVSRGSIALPSMFINNRSIDELRWFSTLLGQE